MATLKEEVTILREEVALLRERIALLEARPIVVPQPYYVNSNAIRADRLLDTLRSLGNVTISKADYVLPYSK